jgi:hypothetical protein
MNGRRRMPVTLTPCPMLACTAKDRNRFAARCPGATFSNASVRESRRLHSAAQPPEIQLVAGVSQARRNEKEQDAKSRSAKTPIDPRWLTTHFYGRSADFRNVSRWLCGKRRFSGRIFDPPMDFAKEAEAAGAYGENVRDPAQIAGALQRGMDQVRAGKPAVLAFWLPRFLQDD